LTTIAVSNGFVAVDSQVTGGNYVVRGQKVFRLPDGGVVAGCGSYQAAYAGIKWLLDGERGDGPDIEGAQLVIVRPDHSIWIAEERWPAAPILDKEYAAGCGADLARLLLAQGKSPVQAVAEACELDAMSSGPILAMAVLPTPVDPGLQYFDVKQLQAKAAKPRKRVRK
jgi:hypothetical protein